MEIKVLIFFFFSPDDIGSLPDALLNIGIPSLCESSAINGTSRDNAEQSKSVPLKDALKRQIKTNRNARIA